MKLHHLAIASEGGFIILFFLFAYWLFWPYQVFSFTKPIRVLNQRTAPGFILTYEMDYCKSAGYDLTADVQLVFSDHLLHFAPFQREALPSGCDTHQENIQMPDLAPGVYRLQMYREYHVNPVRTIRLASESQPFEITERPDVIGKKK